MTREELQSLSRDQLIDLVLQQEALIQQLSAQVATLEARVAELEARLSQPPKTPANSSVPPAKSYKADRKPAAGKGKKRGPKLGHPGVTRPPAEPDLHVELRVEWCDSCGQDLTDQEQQSGERRQLVDLPPIRPVVIEAQSYRVVCPGCGQEHKAPFPEEFTAPCAFSPRVQTLVAYLHEVHHLPYGRLVQVLGELGLKVSPGSLVNLVRRTGAGLEEAAEAIRQEVVQSPVVASDETGARVEGKNQWQWVFRTPQASYYRIAPSRGSQVIHQVFGEARPEVWVSDLWSAQQKAPAGSFQLCHAHQLRDLEFAKECGDKTFAPAMGELLRQSQELAREREALSEEEFGARRGEVYRRCDELLAQEVKHPEGWNLQQRYRRHQDKLFVFLERPEVPYENNGSERDLRNSVVHRKVTGGFRSEWAPEVFATITTVVETAKKRGHGVLDALLARVGSALPQVPNPRQLPVPGET